MPARRIDLHAHSTASDGTLSPAELVLEAAGQDLDVVALTDHDTTAGWSQAAAVLPDGLQLVRGVELSCAHDGISLHVLGLLFDPDEPAFAAARLRLRQGRETRGESMARLLEQAGTGVTWARVRELAGGTVGRPHVAEALVEQGHVATVGDAFTDRWIGGGGRYYVAKPELPVLEGIALIAGAGGAAVFAHPGAHRRGPTVGDDVIADMAAAGMVALEVDHLDHDLATRAHLRGLAGELGLLCTGGSDFHGTAKAAGFFLGANLTDEAVFEALVARTSGVPVLAAAPAP